MRTLGNIFDLVVAMLIVGAAVALARMLLQ